MTFLWLGLETSLSRCKTAASASSAALQHAENSICHMERMQHCSKVDKAVAVEWMWRVCFFFRGHVGRPVCFCLLSRRLPCFPNAFLRARREPVCVQAGRLTRTHALSVWEWERVRWLRVHMLMTFPWTRTSPNHSRGAGSSSFWILLTPHPALGLSRIHAERWAKAPAANFLRKQALNPKQQEGNNFQRFVFHICSSLLRDWTLKNSWGSILKAWHFQWGLNTWNLKSVENEKLSRLHERATLSLLAVEGKYATWQKRILSSAFFFQGVLLFSVKMLTLCQPWSGGMLPF